MKFAKSNPYEVILVPLEALGNTDKRKNDKLLERFAGIKAAFDAISQNPSRYTMMVISSRIADPLAFDVIRQAKKISPRIKVLVALEGNDDGSDRNLQDLPFIDKTIHSPIESIDLAQILPLADNRSEKETLLSELMSLGAEADKFQQCTTDQLRDLVAGLRNLILKTTAPAKPSLSETDKKILKELILSRGKTSSLALSKKLRIPLTTLQRKRKQLESEFLETRYMLKYEKFGFRRAVLFISTLRGNNEDVGTKLLSFKEVLDVHKSIGVHNIDLHAEVLIKDNYELLALIEEIKAMNGVKDVLWSETLKKIGGNTDAMVRALGSD